MGVVAPTVLQVPAIARQRESAGYLPQNWTLSSQQSPAPVHAESQ